MSTAVKPHFKFKQFSIWQDQCAMKVSTDGILLGAWAPINEEVKTVLDIGTGTGLLALMLAQRLADLNAQKKTSDLSTGSPNYKITAVELDCAAAEQAKFNVQQSPWADRIDVIQSDIKEYAPANQQKADLIICNPPYFTKALKSKSTKRTIARHNNNLSFFDLLEAADRLASESAAFTCIIPLSEYSFFMDAVSQTRWCHNQTVEVKYQAQHDSKRVLVELKKLKTISHKEQQWLIVKDEKGNYHDSYRMLCHPFYLKMV